MYKSGLMVSRMGMIRIDNMVRRPRVVAFAILLFAPLSSFCALIERMAAMAATASQRLSGIPRPRRWGRHVGRCS